MIVTLWLTRKCNLHCTYCYEGEKQQKVMQQKTFQDSLYFVTDFFKSSKEEYLGISFHGGEPMLEFDKIIQCKQFFESLEFMKNKVSYMLTTNGTLMTDDQISFLADNVNLSISIDGIKERHDECRIFPNGTGSYELVAENAMKVLKQNKNVRARMTITKEKAPYLYDDFMAVVSMGFKCVDIILDLYTDNWEENVYNQYLIQFEKIKKYLKGNKKDILVNMLRGEFKKRGLCGGGKSSISIDCNGDIYPCMIAVGHSEFVIGDIHNGIDTLLVSRIGDIGLKDNPECQGCEMTPYCEGNRCKIVNYVVNKDYYKPVDSMCMTTNLKNDLL